MPWMIKYKAGVESTFVTCLFLFFVTCILAFSKINERCLLCNVIHSKELLMNYLHHFLLNTNLKLRILFIIAYHILT
uniref:SJCHGC09786 protein n=1 Tax=Schistosoma japonicum TaxID=6182 RepID=Q5BQW3_SCHJA|nr:SJCHGC09786 protein [Schistosoma japonicum]